MGDSMPIPPVAQVPVTVPPSTGHNQDVASNVTIETVKSHYSAEIFELYKKYQQKIHHDSVAELTREQFDGFLVDTPLIYTATPSSSSSSLACGSYFQLYRLGQKLIAVGVVDILPKCLSSVYFFYDPEYAHFQLGKYSALQEIEWIQHQLQDHPGFQYYYMGYYIPTCQKMVYKGSYRPSMLLCPETYDWYPLAQVHQNIENGQYAAFHTTHMSEKKSQSRKIFELILQCPLELTTRSTSRSSATTQLVQLQQLTKEGKRILIPILEAYVVQIGDVLAKKLKIHL